MILAMDDNLVNGQTYTFTLDVAWNTAPIFGLSDAQAVANLVNSGPQYITFPVVHSTHPLFSYGQILVTFVYNGDGSDIVSDAGNEIVTAIDPSLSFVQAETGTTSSTGPYTGEPAPGGPGTPTPQPPTTTTGILSGISTSLIAVAVIALVIVFVLSGGPAAVRSATT
jgi:hypothetical protein